MKANVPQQLKDLESFREIAEAQDAQYAKSLIGYGAQLNKTALRVEQGEYITAGINQSIGIASRITEIGTYNLQQCVGIYINDGKKHGLAHIDGHTEISSLNEFCNDFNRNDLTIKLFGARSLAGTGLNDPQYNLERVTSFLKSTYPGLDIDDLEKTRDQNLKDFIIDGNGQIQNHTLAEGFLDEHDAGEKRALHAIHELRRKYGWQGTYPLIKGNDHTDTPIYLDEAALIKLKTLTNNPSQDITGNLSLDPVSHEFNEAVKIIYNAWSSEVKRLSSFKEENEALKETDITTLLENMPLHIGLGVENSQINTSIANAIKTSESLESLGKALLEITTGTHQFSTINDALNTLAKHDSKLNKEAFLAKLTETYNSQHHSSLTIDQVANKQYGGEITIRDFMLCISKHSSQLGNWGIINSQGGHYNDIDLQPKPYQISDARKALEAISPLGYSHIIDEICEARNFEVNEKINLLQSGTINLSDLTEAIKKIYYNDKNRDKISLAFNQFGAEQINLNELPDFGKFNRLIPENFKETIQNHINTVIIPTKNNFL
jgi:hypothetical protein